MIIHVFAVNAVNNDPCGVWTSLKKVLRVKTLTVTDFLKVNGVNRERSTQPNNPLSVKC